MNEKELLYKLLYQVMIEIREESYVIKNTKIHALSNLVHNVPLMLLKAEGENDFSEIVKKLQEKGQNLGIQNWLKKAMDNLS